MADTSASIEATATAIVDGHIERVQLVEKLIAIRPSPTSGEMALNWGLAAMQMRKTQQEELGKNEWCDLSNEITRQFFDNLCQNLIDSFGDKTLILDLTSRDFKRSITKVSKEKFTPRRKEIYDLFFSLLMNALRLSTGTIALTMMSLSRSDGAVAKSFGIELVDRRTDLADNQRQKLKEIIEAVPWSSQKEEN